MILDIADCMHNINIIIGIKSRVILIGFCKAGKEKVKHCHLTVSISGTGIVMFQHIFDIFFGMLAFFTGKDRKVLTNADIIQNFRSLFSGKTNPDIMLMYGKEAETKNNR